MRAARTLFAGIAAFLVPASFAAAADGLDPDNNPYMDPAPTPTWDGFYVGGEAGGDIGPSAKAADLMGGLHAGYNKQFGQFVLGVEGESNWRPSDQSDLKDWIGSPSGTHYTSKVGDTANFVSTLTARVGYTVGDRLLPFLSAGLAFSDLGMKSTTQGVSGLFAGSYGQNSRDMMRVGWTLGAGLDYKLSQHWTLEGQYQYYSLGTSSLVNYGYLGGVRVSTFTVRYKESGNLATIGVNYRF